ncbi:MAG: homoserine kinase [Bacillota bacterium]|jgi:homoserine kinase
MGPDSACWQPVNEDSSYWEVTVPATSANLGPGFDCLGLALNLHNRIWAKPSERLRFRVLGEGRGELPEDSSNLVWRAAQHLFEQVGYSPPPLSIVMKNDIPTSRGLGSSSAAIVGGLLLANQLVPTPLTEQQLLDLATQLEGHPDNVVPAMLGGMVVSATTSQQVVALSFPFPQELQLVACIPNFRLSTSLARQVLPSQVNHGDATFNASRIALLLAALLQRRYDLLAMAAEDRLHQPYRLGLIPGGAAACQAARQAGAAAAMISGAGPTLLAIVPPGVAAAAVGQQMASSLLASGVSATYKLLQLDLQGAVARTL